MLDIFDYSCFSRTFLKELEGYRGRPEDVGHGFVRNAQMFKQLYVEYCKNMPESNRVILIPEAVTFFDVGACFSDMNIHFDFKVLLFNVVITSGSS